ncbi:unnamed protein product [Mytilus edulis]|uniref:Uncharacterized protein n=1 Tax=Mytilus edulis TaxID=6550 RepID=A0A8S3SPR5_MYTED|nr:unnamed protein product [Mytilus edulis]
MEINKIVCKDIIKKQYYDIWPGFICVCKDESNTPPPFWFCSRHIAIVVEVFAIEDVNPRPSSFCDIPIAYRIVNGYSNEANLISKKIDQLDGRQNQLRTVKGVSNDIAEQLFASHSKLCLISSSLIKSKNIEKRIIPVGEAHFPRSINSVPTDVLEGYPRMLVQQVTIGSEVGPQNGRTGTLGGFVKFHGKDAFLTCAHVIVDRKYLVSNANRADIHENPIPVYCKLPGALPQEYLHKSFINYQEFGTMNDIQIVAVGAVSSIQQVTDKLRLESVRQVEFETLTQAVKSQFIQNPNIDITGRIHYRDVERILEDVGEGERRIPRTVTLYNQISMRKLAFSPGDSGTCIYAKGPDGKFGCIGMAIASHPDGGCIITPIKPILSAFKLI